MIIDFILNLLEPERFSVANRQVRETTPGVIEKSSSIAKPIPGKYEKDVEALRKKYGENFKTGFCIEVILKELLEICPRVLKTVDIRSPKTVISVHFSYSLPMAMQIY